MSILGKRVYYRIKDESREVETHITQPILTGVYNGFFSNEELHKILSYEGNALLMLAFSVTEDTGVIWRVQEALASV